MTPDKPPGYFLAMNRRAAFGKVFGLLAVVSRSGGFVPPSEDGVPRRLDCRKKDNDSSAPIEIWRNGTKLDACVAYDLDEQWVLVLRLAPDGYPCLTGYEDRDLVRLTGGINVTWDRVELARRQALTRK